MKTLIAALTFFPRLPIWRLIQVDAIYYKRVVNCWSAIGWLTGGVLALTLFGAAHLFPYTVAVLMAFGARLLLTGALHEDGLADFLDGFGGGTSPERVLAIMKDSHIGTYGVIGLIFYFLMAVAVVSSLPLQLAVPMLLAGDCWSKFSASQIVNLLPYARTEDTAKNHTVYTGMKPLTWIGSMLCGKLALLLLPSPYQWAALPTFVASMLLIFFIKGRIKGYTGDCCGAVFLISEMVFYLTVCAIYMLT